MLNQVEICNNFILFLNFSVFLFLIKETTKKKQKQQRCVLLENKNDEKINKRKEK